MAYLRAYQAMGDPFLGSAFKSLGRAVKRFKPGRFLLGNLGRFGGFIPGVGIAGQAAGLMFGRGRRRALPMGDPFLGSMLGPAARAISKAATSIFPGTGAMGMKSAASGFLQSRLGGSIASGLAAGGAGALIGRALGGGGGGERRAYRRMNPGNVRALRRSIRRVDAFRKLAMSTVRLHSQVRVRKRKRR